MSRARTNFTSFQYALEASLATLPGSPVWKTLEPNSINEFGSTITTVARKPISKKRQTQKGTPTDLNSSVAVESDLILETFKDFTEAFVFAQYNGPASFSPTAVTTTGYTVASGGALAQYTLIYVRGCLTAANNGFKVVGASSTGTEIKTSGLTAETLTAANNATVEICGVQGASGDIVMTAGGNLTSTTLDFTTLSLTVGQFIKIGGTASGEKFATAANNGYARITAIAAGQLTLDKKSGSFAADSGTGKTIQLFFGKFGRNVAVDDADYIEKSYTFEAGYQDLGGIGTPEYEYAKGNYCNTLALSLPLANKATAAFGFIGTDTDVPTTSRATNADTPYVSTQRVAFNTSSNIAVLSLKNASGTDLTAYFKELTLTLNNNVAPEKTLATLGATFMNAGNFDVTVSGRVLFTADTIVSAIRNNTTVTLHTILKNDDGGIALDIPSMTLGGGKKDYPLNETILVNLAGTAFEDATLGTSIGISLFPYLPT